MSSSSFSSPTHPSTSSHLTKNQELKQKYEMKMMFQLSRPLIKKIRLGSFPAPSGFFLSKAVTSQNKKQAALEAISQTSTAASSDCSDDHSPTMDLEEPANSVYDEIIQDFLTQKDKRALRLVKMLSLFEERCAVERLLDRNQIDALRVVNRDYLGICLSKFQSLKCQQIDSVFLSILLLSTSKLGISKKIFLAICNKILPKKTVKVSFVRKARCYKVILMWVRQAGKN
jgi:hypothetical protein